ncbi:hypothetical protein ADL15_19240 [Actinoplanes awajinensis subsp. mycoplanecinus]|uniref:IPT/TIG domain-containing protein n=2 Tax=Actinoplanes awajinensis TaxID=135946 RepID=A0A124GAL9_9ACTN|nr:hypothetical protein ADL15_19240 [Actinoplanes awajinensis subsp. mycoplanecinus]
MEKASSRRRKALQFGAVVGVTAAAVLSANPAMAAVEVATVSPSSGPTAGGNTVTLSVATLSDPAQSFIQGSTAVTLENAATCSASLTAAPSFPLVAPAAVTVVSATKLAFTVPSGATTTGGISAANDYNVCAYSAPGAVPGASTAAWTLIGKAEAAGGTYHVGASPTITSITPRAAGTQGGGTLIISGTGLDSTGTWSLGGTTVTPTVNGAFTLATVTIPAHAAGGPFALVHTKSEGGTAIYPAAFTYAAGLNVTPNTASNTKARTDVSVTGTNFSSINFTTTTGKTPDDANGHVYLVKGNYDPAKTGLVKANPQTTECLNVVPISDSELLCSLYLAGGGYSMSTARTVSATVTGTTLTAAAGAFGPADVGMLVTGPTTITAGTYITAIIDPTKVMLSKAPTAAITTATNIVLSPSRSFSDATLTASSTALTSGGTAAFAASDVGRPISGVGIPAGTTISAVGSATGATLSQAATASASGTYVIGAAPLNEVPIGVYTVTVVNSGAVDAQNTPAYQRSVINSGSTFTVADF